jgi:sugar O-acyltransferase (sialic acid O-acetyltransferase NeuD family)
MGAGRNLLIVGDSSFAEVAHEYFNRDSNYQVVGFAVERAFLNRDELFGLPVIALEDMKEAFPPEQHDVYVALVYSELNRLRARLAAAVTAMGYDLASFVSPHARISPSATLGRHCFVFEDNVIQPFVSIGDDVVLWSGNHIGHHSSIGDHCFISSHVVVSGHCSIGENCFLGVNAAVANDVRIGKDCWVGPGVVVSADTEARQMFPGAKAEASRVDTHRFFKLKE